MTKGDYLRAVSAGIEQTIDRVIAENLIDPDLAAMSSEYKDGYTRGFREASVGFITERLTKPAADQRQLIRDLKTAAACTNERS